MEKKKWVKKEIPVTLEMFDEFCETELIDDIIKMLRAVKKYCESKGFRNIRMVHEIDYDSCHFEFWGERLETNAELARRLKRSKAAKKAAAKRKREKEKKERALLKKLKARYE